MIEDYYEAQKICIKKLKKVGIKTNDHLDGEHFNIKMNGMSNWSNYNYDQVKITISTPYHRSYTSTNLYMRKFDIINGDYEILKNKINTIIKKDKQMMKEIKEKTREENNLFNNTLSMFKKYNPKIDEGYSLNKSFEMNINKLTIYVRPTCYPNVSFTFNGEYKDLIKLLDKIKEEK